MDLGNRRIQLAVGIMLLALITFVVVSVLKRLPTETVYFTVSGAKLDHGITSSAIDDALLVSTNRNLVLFNPKSGETSLLMSDGPLPEISNIKWSPNQKQALFEAHNITSNDVLGSILVHDKLPVEENAWWVADFTTKKYVPLRANAKDMGWISDTELYAVGRPEGKVLGLYKTNIQTIAYENIVLKESLLGAYSIPGGFLIYYSADKAGVVSRISNGQETRLITNITRPLQVNRPGSLATVFQASGKQITDDPEFSKDTLLIIATDTGKVIKKLASKQSDEGTWSAIGDAYYFRETKSGNILKAAIDQDRVSMIRIKAVLPTNEHINKLLVSGDGTLFSLSSKNILSVGSNNKNDAIKIYKTRPVVSSEGFISDGFILYYDQATDIYDVVITGTPFETYQAKAIQAIDQAGDNGNLADISYDFEKAADQPASDNDNLVSPNELGE